MNLIVVDMLPYSIVEGEAFTRLNIGDPLSAHRYKVKSEKYYRTTLMSATYDKVMKHVKKPVAGGHLDIVYYRWMEQSNKIMFLTKLHGSFHS
jgi:hypothetical protein